MRSTFRDQQLMKLPDAEILQKARSENRIVLTFDLDFGDLLAASGENLPSVIIFRLRKPHLRSRPDSFPF